MAKYEPKVIQTFADRLYARAAAMMFVWTVVGAGIGAAAANKIYGPGDGGTRVWVGAGAAAVLGLLYGYWRTFLLRFQAQAALCQMHIELNTRRMAATSSVGVQNAFSKIQP